MESLFKYDYYHPNHHLPTSRYQIKSTPPSYNTLTFCYISRDAPLLNLFVSSERQWWLHIFTFVSVHEELPIAFFI